MGSDAPKPRFPPAPGEGVSDYRAPQPRAGGEVVHAPDRSPPRRVLVAPADDPLSPEALAAYRARREAHHRRLARRGALLAIALVLANVALLAGATFLLRRRVDGYLLGVLIAIAEGVVFVALMGRWSAAENKTRRHRNTATRRDIG